MNFLETRCMCFSSPAWAHKRRNHWSDQIHKITLWAASGEKTAMALELGILGIRILLEGCQLRNVTKSQLKYVIVCRKDPFFKWKVFWLESLIEVSLTFIQPAHPGIVAGRAVNIHRSKHSTWDLVFGHTEQFQVSWASIWTRLQCEENKELWTDRDPKFITKI